MSQPLYVSRVAAPDIGIAALRPQSANVGEGSQSAFNAIAQAGGAVMDVAARKLDGERTAEQIRRETTARAELDALETDFLQAPDQDWKTASSRYEEKAKEIRNKAGDGLDDMRRAVLDRSLNAHSIVGLGKIQNKAFQWQGSSALASLDQNEVMLVGKAAASNTPVERAAHIAAHDQGVDGVAAVGWMTPQAAQERKTRFRATLDDADAQSSIRRDPVAARAALDDPAQFPTLSPARREQLKSVALNHADDVTGQQIRQVGAFDPSRALGMTGRIANPQDVDTIFTKALIPVESGGNPNAESPKGASGLTQMMPGTAREMAGKLGLSDVAALSDEAIKARLKQDPALAIRMGKAYFTEGAVRYDGNLWATAARYNAGPGNDTTPRADAWHAEATAKFGPSYTAGQLASVITVPETRNYVLAFAARLGVDPGAPGLSPAASFRVASMVSDDISKDRSRQSQLISRMASAAEDENSYVDRFKRGADIAPSEIAAQRTLLTAAAASGKTEDLNRLRTFNEAAELAPLRREAYGIPPQQLEQETAAERQRVMAGGGNVKRLDMLEAVSSEVAKLAKSDPISLGETARLFTPVAIDPQADFRGAEIRDTMAYRAVQAASVQSRYGGAVNPFKPAEAEALKARFADATPTERADILTGMAGAMRNVPAAYDAAVKAIVGSDKYAETAAVIARDRPELAREVIIGSSILRQEGVRPHADEIRTALKATIKGELYPRAADNEAVLNAALAIYAGRRGSALTLWDKGDQDGIKQAIETVTGKIETINGRPVPLPSSLNPGLALSAITNLTAQDIEARGGAVNLAGQSFDAKWLSSNAVFLPTGVGATTVVVAVNQNGRDPSPVFTRAGRPLVLDIGEITNAHRSRLTTEQQRLRAVYPDQAPLDRQLSARDRDRARAGLPPLGLQ